MEDFQFIIESPQHSQGHKKRPRLVTSCDNCRLKKIKCLQSAPETQCEACKVSKIPCKFRDRERYFAERSRSIAGSSAAGTSYDSSGSASVHTVERVAGTSHEHFNRTGGSSSSTHPISLSSHAYDSSSFGQPANSVLTEPIGYRASSYSPASSSYESEGHGRYRSHPPDPRRNAGVQRFPHSSAVPPIHSKEDLPYIFSPSSQPYPISSSPHPPMIMHTHQRQLQLFDPDQPQSPNRTLMPHFIDIFFRYMNLHCPFISYDETLRKFHNRTLSPLLANSIASLAARVSDILELRWRDDAGEVYDDTAKDILTRVAHIPALDHLHAVMILAWSEYKLGNVNGFRAYSQMAMSTALDLGLSVDGTFHTSSVRPDREQLRVTWSSVVQLNNFASSSL